MNKAQEFLEAVKAGDAARVKAMIESDTTLPTNARDAQGISATLLAVYHGHSEVVNLLLDAGVELDIFEAAATGSTRRLEALLDADAKIINTHSPDGFAPLNLATFFGRKETVERLLARGADPNIASKNAMRVRPLNSAMAHRQPEVALAMGEMLLDHGADPNVAQAGGWTPLREAAAHGHVDTKQNFC